MSTLFKKIACYNNNILNTFLHREIQEKLRAFSQFHTASEHELMLKNVSKERALRLRVRELIKYRRNGLTRQEECTEYERQRYFRERRRDAKLERQRRKSVRVVILPFFRSIFLFRFVDLLCSFSLDYYCLHN